MFDNEIQLTIRKRAEDKQWHLRPEFSLEGKVGYPVSLGFPRQFTKVFVHVVLPTVMLLVISIIILPCANIYVLSIMELLSWLWCSGIVRLVEQL